MTEKKVAKKTVAKGVRPRGRPKGSTNKVKPATLSVDGILKIIKECRNQNVRHIKFQDLSIDFEQQGMGVQQRHPAFEDAPVPVESFTAEELEADREAKEKDADREYLEYLKTEDPVAYEQLMTSNDSPEAH